MNLWYNEDMITQINSTCRSTGAIGPKAIVPDYVSKNVNKSLKILDFGAGRDALHTLRLRREGFLHVDAYDFGANTRDGLHVLRPKSTFYNVVFLSNVLNVQPSEEYIHAIIQHILGLFDWRSSMDRLCLFNYPRSPRYSGLSLKQIIEIIEDHNLTVQKFDKRGVYGFYF